MKKGVLPFLMFIGCLQVQAQEKSEYLVRSVISNSGSSQTIKENNKEYILQQSIGQQGVIGTYITESYVVRQGFIQPDVLAKIVDSSLPLDLSIVLAPNPFTERISVLFNDKITTQIETSVFDMSGKMLFEKTFPSTAQLDLPLEHLPNANYILLVRANNRQFAGKIVKK